MESYKPQNLFQFALAFFLIGAFFLVIILLFYELYLWRQARNTTTNNNNASNNLESPMDIFEGRVGNHVHVNHMEIFLRLREELAGVHLQTQQPPRMGERRRRERVITNLPPPIDYDNYKKTVTTTECAICLEDFESGDLCRHLPLCNHIYHLGCINRWLIEEPTCPICRTSISNA
ncbi:E3 ubiquitin-protein ligase ATL41-like [Mercurialis annua]|uniref:E3 ubiquitin-protein ligase ATL41-like n=1 Tax=Mercurialis annua TaxID=3986 RepID=UPI00215E42AF|nr:E3 ubiquitin-protein ligase ATL41-like [Mercurialis annua]